MGNANLTVIKATAKLLGYRVEQEDHESIGFSKWYKVIAPDGSYVAGSIEKLPEDVSLGHWAVKRHMEDFYGVKFTQ